MRSVAPDAQVVAVTHRWGDYYTRRVQAVLDGTWRSEQVWGGVGAGFIRVEGFGRKVPASVQKEVNARQTDMAAGKLPVFAAARGRPVRDNTGKVVIEPGQALTDAQILEMNWLAEGVQGHLK
jgi:simple sugar transport system substrate-binding protein